MEKRLYMARPVHIKGRMHSTPTEGSSGDEDDVESTVQGTLDRYARLAGTRAPEAEEPRAVGHRHGALTATAAASVERPPAPVQRSIDAFTVDGDAPAPELEARAPRAMAALALEREIERVARRQAKAGVSRDELVIAVARECNVPLDDLTLVDAYISDLVLEGKLRLVGERVLLAPEPREPTAPSGPTGPTAASRASHDGGRAGPRARRRSAKGRGGKGRGRRGAGRRPRRKGGPRGGPRGRRSGRGARARGGDDA
jgi:hypothetical protein